jgi:hypothetical protein
LLERQYENFTILTETSDPSQRPAFEDIVEKFSSGVPVGEKAKENPSELSTEDQRELYKLKKVLQEKKKLLDDN